jgi:hypothetical protein
MVRKQEEENFSEVLNVLKSLIMDSKNDVLLYDNFIIEPDRTSVHLSVPHMTEALTSSYCC